MYKNGHMDLLPPAGLWKVVVRVPVFIISLVVINKLIDYNAVTKFYCDWIQIKNLRVLLFRFFKCIFSSGIGIAL